MLKQTGDKYPSCLLCKENEGFAGNMNHPARQTHRIIPMSFSGENWFLQYSPYTYYNEQNYGDPLAKNAKDTLSQLKNLEGYTGLKFEFTVSVAA